MPRYPLRLPDERVGVYLVQLGAELLFERLPLGDRGRRVNVEAIVPFRSKSGEFILDREGGLEFCHVAISEGRNANRVGEVVSRESARHECEPDSREHEPARARAHTAGLCNT